MSLTSASFQNEHPFLRQYARGTKVEVIVRTIIPPSQIITGFSEEFSGRLSMLDMSWCVPEAEAKFRALKVGDLLQCVVLDFHLDTMQVRLGQKQSSPPLSNTISWERIERGDESQAVLVEELHKHYLLKTPKGLFGMLPKHFMQVPLAELKIRIDAKLEDNDLLSVVPAGHAVEEDTTTEARVDAAFDFIDEDLRSFSSFKKSILSVNASDDTHVLIQRGFENDERLFAKEIATNHCLYLQFDNQGNLYNSVLSQQTEHLGNSDDKINEKEMLDRLSAGRYWFRIERKEGKTNENNNRRAELIEFTLFNENIYVKGIVRETRDRKECSFLIREFGFGHSTAWQAYAKKKNARDGAFLFTNPLKILSPFESVPLYNGHQIFLDSVLLKTKCFELVYDLKLDAGEILRQEGRTLAIIDRFLEYQIDQIKKQKDTALFVDRYKQIPGSAGNVAIELDVAVADSLEITEDTMVNVRVKQQDDLLKLTDGMMTNNQNNCTIGFTKEVKLQQMANGFYVDRRIPTSHLEIQREIIRDFLQKKIKIDHIESLLVNPDAVKTPVLSQVTFRNPDLVRTEQNQPDNNQVRAVKKAVGNQNVFLIQGPPGTGKTTVIAEIIEQLVAKGEKILVAGQNHVAVDNVLKKMSGVHSLQLLRVGHPDKIDRELVQYHIENMVELYKTDYYLFLSNQLSLAKEFLNLKKEDHDNTTFLEKFTALVNERAKHYGMLKDIFRDRHFVLRDGLRQFKTEELPGAVEVLEKWVNNNRTSYEILLKPLIYQSVNVVFATCLGIKSDTVFKNAGFKFNTVIIDEAGKAGIAESLVAMELGKRVILVGDQKQLPPYFDSALIDENEEGSFPKSKFGSGYSQNEIAHALKTSFFEFIINRIDARQFPSENKEMLNYQHRMHPNIGEFVSKSFYDGEVFMGDRTHLNTISLPTPFDKEIVFLDTSNSSRPYEETDGNSVKNTTEAEAIAEIILPRLFESHVPASSIAIIAPYKSQVTAISHCVQKSKSGHAQVIDIATLDSFQGKEYDIIIFSFTRSADYRYPARAQEKRKSTKVGFLDDARRLNVAFSRAKKRLILVGNAKTLVNPRSHFDLLFNYTRLFETLVSLSKSGTIGRFVNIVDLPEYTAPFDVFVKRYKKEDKVSGKVDGVFWKKDNTLGGLFVTVSRLRCIIPVTLMRSGFRDRITDIKNGDPIDVQVYNIDTEYKKVTVIIPGSFPVVKRVRRIDNSVNWDKVRATLKKNHPYKGSIQNKNEHGYFILLECGLMGLLHISKVDPGKPLDESKDINVVILSIDENLKRLTLKLYHGGI